MSDRQKMGTIWTEIKPLHGSFWNAGGTARGNLNVRSCPMRDARNAGLSGDKYVSPKGSVMCGELKPCPVCGEQPRWRGSPANYRAGIFRLQCLGETHLFQSYGPSEAACIENWNTRADETLLTAVREMREALAFYGCEHPWPNDGPWGIDSNDFGDLARATLTKYAGIGE